MTLYDYIIVGGGPSGLTLAWYLSKNNKKILVVDKNKTIGGCHRVNRINSYFSEHGPRVYIGAYVKFMQLLTNMNMDFNDLFVKSDFSPIFPTKELFHTMSICEYGAFTLAFIKHTFGYSSLASMQDFCIENNFSKQTMDIIDKLCRLTDGADITRYTQFQFLELLNQNILYNIYQPKKPNDVLLFPQWQNKLLEQNVEILLDTHVSKILFDKNIVNGIVVNNKHIYGEKVILAIPPKNISELLVTSNVNTIYYGKYGNLKNTNEFVSWSMKSCYIDYVPITFHWNKKINLKKVYGGLGVGTLGVVFVVLSDYTDFSGEVSKTVISCLITKPENIKQMNKDDIVKTVFNELLQVFGNLEKYNKVIVAKNEYNSAINDDTAFVLTKYGYGPTSCDIKNMYFLGCFNGYSTYHFTSLENAVENAMYVYEFIK